MNVNFKMFVDVQHYSNLSDTVNYSSQTSYISPQLPHLHNKAGFSIEGGTRRLIAAYFGIYSRLLCV